MPSLSRNPARSYKAFQDTSLPPEVRVAVAHVRLFSRVAEQVGLDASHVLRVAKGKRQSKRVIDAIVREVRRIERESGIALG